MEKEKEILKLGDKCTIEFTKEGNVTIGEGCKGAQLNPAEIQILDRINKELDNT